MKKGEIYNNRNRKPILLHLAANVNGNKYLKYIGYNTNKIRLHGSYKFKQVFNLMCLVFNKNWQYILLILILINSVRIYRNKLLNKYKQVITTQ